MALRSGVAVHHTLLISPLLRDFCLRDFQLESHVNLVYSDTQGDNRGLRRPGYGKYPGWPTRGRFKLWLRIKEKAMAGGAVPFIGAEMDLGIWNWADWSRSLKWGREVALFLKEYGRLAFENVRSTTGLLFSSLNATVLFLPQSLYVPCFFCLRCSSFCAQGCQHFLTT